MSMMEQAKERARRNRKRIALPEGEESRTVQAAARIRDEGLAEPILIGDPDRIRETGKKTGTDLCGLETVNPETSPKLLAYADNVSVRCSGMVNFDVEDDVRQWIYENNPVLPRLYTSWESLAYFCLPIAEMDYFDLTPTPPLFKHFDLMTGEVSNGFVGERFKNK